MSENELGLTVFETECYNKHYENLEKLSDGRLSGTILRDLFKTSLLPTLVLKEVISILFHLLISNSFLDSLLLDLVN